MHCVRSFSKARGLADHVVKVHIRKALGTGEMRILPHDDPYDIEYRFVAAWVDTDQIGVCGFVGRRVQQRPAAPANDLSNLLASRTIKKGKARPAEDEE